MTRIVRSALVEYSALDMYLLVENIEDYPQFLPWCRASRVLERSDGRTLASLSLGIKGVRQSLTTENLNTRAEAIDLRLVEGPFSMFSASWRFKALGPRAARIEFSIAYEFSSKVLGRVLEPLFDQIANSMVDAFIRRAEVVHGTAER